MHISNRQIFALLLTALSIVLAVIVINKLLEQKTMADKNTQPNSAASGAGTASGQSTTVDSSAEPLKKVAPATESGVQEIPIGAPVSPEELKKLKKAAEKVSPPADSSVQSIPIGTPASPEDFKKLKKAAEKPSPQKQKKQSEQPRQDESAQSTKPKK